MGSKGLLTLLILVGLILGLVVGQWLYDEDFSLTMSDNEHKHATAIIAFHFIGDTIFLGLLKMLIIPLIATSVIVGVTSVGDFRELGKIGLATLIYYFVTMGIAACIGLVLVTLGVQFAFRNTVYSEGLHDAGFALYMAFPLVFAASGGRSCRWQACSRTVRRAVLFVAVVVLSAAFVALLFFAKSL